MKCSDIEYNGSPWEWRLLGVVDPGSGGPSPKIPKFRPRCKFRHNSVAESSPTSAYTFIIFINRTSIYTITFMHLREGRLGSRVRVSLVIRNIEKIFYAAEVIYLAFLSEYSDAEAPGYLHTTQNFIYACVNLLCMVDISNFHVS